MYNQHVFTLILPLLFALINRSICFSSNAQRCPAQYVWERNSTVQGLLRLPGTTLLKDKCNFPFALYSLFGGVWGWILVLFSKNTQKIRKTKNVVGKTELFSMKVLFVTSEDATTTRQHIVDWKQTKTLQPVLSHTDSVLPLNINFSLKKWIQFCSSMNLCKIFHNKAFSLGLVNVSECSLSKVRGNS